MIVGNSTLNKSLKNPAGNLSSNKSFSLIVEPNDGIDPIISLINNANKSIDLVMYQLEDVQVEQALVAAQNRGVAVRVLINEGYYGKPEIENQKAYSYLKAHGVSVRWTPAYFALTHQKTIIVDKNDALIMTFNFTPQYYSSDRDFAINDRNKNDISEIEKVFDADWKDNKIASLQNGDLV